jgi:hypothetical protein
VDVPCGAQPGNTFSRWRLSSAGGLSIGGVAMDGEVEDHPFLIKGLDFGDADDGFDTTFAAGGPSHGVDPAAAFFLGACVDTEADGAASATATGDDLAVGNSTTGTCAGGDDEDGVTFDSMVIACGSASLTVTSSAVGVLDAWIDLDGSGDFTGPDDQIFSGQALAAGTNSLSFDVPCDAAAGTTTARFRLSSAGVASFGGPAMDGEVEDYTVLLKGVDFGDAPDSYSTLFASSGPHHGLDPASGLFLGACIDSEVEGQPSGGADGDDLGAGASNLGVCASNDDEDGVSFDTPVTACKPATITVTASAPGMLDAWIDYDGDGTFGGAAEQIFAAEPMLVGPASLEFTVPCSAVDGSTYARFRLSSVGGLGIGGPAIDGEVEDYLIATNESDFGDAPDTYGTLFASGGATHGVDLTAGLFLGACVDTEDEGAPSMLADGDDLAAGTATAGTCVGGDDEDGVSFDTMVIACQQASLTVTASAAGLLDAWIDFDGDGTFAGPADRILSAQALVAGPNVLNLGIPCDAAPGDTYARFRFSSAGVAGSGGTSPDGEVEDYPVLVKGSDLGDAPDTYGTLFASDGPRHGMDPAVPLFLGACIDGDVDGQPTVPADGDDLGVGTILAGVCATPNDDEDGVVFDSMLVTCLQADLTVTASAAGLLDAWIDFDGAGTFAGPGEQIFAAQALLAGPNALSFDVPCDAVTGDTYIRLRFSSAGVGAPTGPAMDGEVEDHLVVIKGLDFGDAPDPTYPVLLASGGAHHIVQPVDNPTLGSLVDSEPDGQPDGNHSGDDNGGEDDEDGVSFSGVLVPGTDGEITLTGGATGGLVSAWVDFDLDGQWQDPAETVIADLALGAGETTTVTFAVPPGTPEGTSCARVRISSQAGLAPTGLAPDGEVEDYSIALGVEAPDIGIAKDLVDILDEGGGVFLITFDLRLENLGNVPLSEVGSMVDLVVAFDGAAGFEVDSASSAEFILNPAFDGDLDSELLAPGNSLAVGGAGNILLLVRLDSGFNPGPYECTSEAAGLSPAGMTVTDLSQNGTDPDPDGNGSGIDNNDPTVVEVDALLIDIPTLGSVGMGLLLLLLAVAGLRRLRQI